MRTKQIITILLLVVTVCNGQRQILDSLQNELSKTKNDSVKCVILADLVTNEPNDNICIGYANKIVEITNTNLKKQLSQSLKRFYLRKLCQAYGGLSTYNENKGNITVAFDLRRKALQIAEQTQDKVEQVNNLIGLFDWYGGQGDTVTAKQQVEKALKIARESKDKSLIANCYILLGDNASPDSSIVYYEKGLALYKELGITQFVAQAYGDIGGVYKKINNFSKSLEYYQKSLAIKKSVKDSSGIARTCNAISAVYIQIKEYDKALPYAKTALELGQQIKNAYRVKSAAENLKKIFRAKNQCDKSIEMYELEYSMKDSLFNEENRKSSIRNQVQIEYDRKAFADSLKAEGEKNRIVLENQLELDRQQNQKNILYFGLSLVLVFSTILFNRFRLIKKQKQVIEHHQKEITDSINYAKRLQEAILPTEQQFKSLLPDDSFVYYRPKDIVAGDFYWIENVGDLVLFAAADCTGHGVPGAMVSVVCSNALNRAVLEFGITDPGKILDKVRELVIATFEKSGAEIKDGMDISLCSLNKKTNELKWAGANNPLWVVDHSNKNLWELKGDKQPIGKCDNPQPFYTHSVMLESGRSIYLFTDGYADQFGGPKGKKFMYKQMKDIIREHCEENMLSQKLHLDVAFGNWMNVNEQVDDVCVIGVRV